MEKLFKMKHRCFFIFFFCGGVHTEAQDSKGDNYINIS